jgi:hypothetical protein
LAGLDGGAAADGAQAVGGGPVVAAGGRQVSCSHQTAWLVLRSNDGRWARSAWEPGEGRLSVADRAEISLGVHRGQTFSAIASRLGRATSTVSREVAANGGRDGYRAWRAHERARERARRPKRPKLACPRLAATVASRAGCWREVGRTRTTPTTPTRSRSPRFDPGACDGVEPADHSDVLRLLAKRNTDIGNHRTRLVTRPHHAVGRYACSSRLSPGQAGYTFRRTGLVPASAGCCLS